MRRRPRPGPAVRTRPAFALGPWRAAVLALAALIIFIVPSSARDPSVNGALYPVLEGSSAGDDTVNDYSDLSLLLELIEEAGREVREPRFGTNEGDEIAVGRGASRVLYALDGADAIRGSRSDDGLGGGSGNDTILGRGGDDIITGGEGDDDLNGFGGADTINGGDGNDRVNGRVEADVLSGEAGDDTILGGTGDDTIAAGDGMDIARGGRGDDVLQFEGLLSDYTFVRSARGALIVTANDGSGTVRVLNVETVVDETGTEATADDTGVVTLQLLHASDLEGNADAVEDAPNFATIIDALEDQFANTLLISGGDNVIPSPFSNAAGTQNPEVRATLNAVLNEVMSQVTGRTYSALESSPGRFDMAIMNAIGFDATVLGNHDLDFGQQQFVNFVGEENGGTPGNFSDDTWTGALFPYLSGNVVVEPESVVQGIYDADGIQAGEDGTGVLAPFTILEQNGEQYGVIGATTQLLASITSTGGDPNNPNDDLETPPGEDDMAALAAVIQPIVDAMERQGVNKIILTTQLQQLQNEITLSRLLDGVDIIIAGGSDTILSDGTDRLREDDESMGPYPIIETDAGGSATAILSTDGQYKYVGRLVVDFDQGGNLIAGSIDDAVSGAYATDEQGVLDVTGAASLDEAIAGSAKGSKVKRLVDTISEATLVVSGRNYFADTTVDLNGEREPGVRTEETNLGSLTADANLQYSRELSGENVLVSIKNGGGIRSSISGEDGFISELEIQQALAFNNGLSLITLTPEQLLETLNTVVAESTYDAAGAPTNAQGRFAQVGGLRYSFDPAQPAGQRVQDVVLLGAGAGGTDVKIFEDGVATVDAADFAGGIRVVTLGFLLTGGDSYPFENFVAANAAFANVRNLVNDELIADGAAQFAAVGTEQDAFAEYLAANFGVDNDPTNDLSVADTPAADDFRIVNLGIPGVSDIEL